jgi:hypothetical protein
VRCVVELELVLCEWRMRGCEGFYRGLGWREWRGWQVGAAAKAKQSERWVEEAGRQAGGRAAPAV